MDGLKRGSVGMSLNVQRLEYVANVAAVLAGALRDAASAAEMGGDQSRRARDAVAVLLAEFAEGAVTAQGEVKVSTA
jgi:hypothetical protein